MRPVDAADMHDLKLTSSRLWVPTYNRLAVETDAAENHKRRRRTWQRSMEERTHCVVPITHPYPPITTTYPLVDDIGINQEDADSA